MTKKDIKSYFLIILTSAILTLISMMPIGILSVISIALATAIIGYSVTKHHYAFVGCLCAFMLLIYTFFSKSFTVSLSVWLPMTLSGLSLGITYNLKLSEFFATGLITGVYTIFILLSVKLSGIFSKELLNDTLSSSISMYKEAFAEVYGTQFTQSQIETLVSETMGIVVKFMPCFLIIICGILALLMLYCFKNVLKISKSDLSMYKTFSDWHADRSLCIVFLITFAISFILPENSYISAAIANVLFISLVVFFIFGLSLSDFLLKRKLKSSFFRKVILIVLVFFFFGLPFFVLCLLGIIDGFMDFRRKFTKNNLPEQE